MNVLFSFLMKLGFRPPRLNMALLVENTETVNKQNIKGVAYPSVSCLLICTGDDLTLRLIIPIS